MVIDVILTTKVNIHTRRMLILKDLRASNLQELFYHIEHIKLYAWELHFILRIVKRRVGVMNLAKVLFFYTRMKESLVIIVDAVAMICLLVPSISRGNKVDLISWFIGSAFVGQLKDVLWKFPPLYAAVTSFKIKFDRVQMFLRAEEPTHISFDSNKTGTIELDNCSLSWSSKDEEPLIQDLTMSIANGELIGLIGESGSGKTGFLSSLIGELHIKKGNIQVNGKISFVTQQPWLFKASIRDNILLNTHFDSTKYERVVRSCCLLPDLELMKDGDMTQIIENGANLSGGQQKRIHIARSLYNESDIYLLDEPFAGLDQQVALSIMSQAIFPLKKTRILVVNQVELLKEVDRIFLISNRQITPAEYSSLAKHQNLAQYTLGTLYGSSEAKQYSNIDSKNDQNLTRKDVVKGELIISDVPVKILLEWFKAIPSYLIPLITVTVFTNISVIQAYRLVSVFW